MLLFIEFSQSNLIGILISAETMTMAPTAKQFSDGKISDLRVL